MDVAQVKEYPIQKKHIKYKGVLLSLISVISYRQNCFLVTLAV